MASQGNQTFKEKMIPNLHTLLENDMREYFQLIYEASISLIPKSDEDIIKRANNIPSTFVITDAKINKI